MEDYVLRWDSSLSSLSSHGDEDGDKDEDGSYSPGNVSKVTIHENEHGGGRFCDHSSVKLTDWLDTIPYASLAGRTVAIILDGSVSMNIARSHLRYRFQDPKDKRRSLITVKCLHGHLNDCREELASLPRPFVLLSTEAFYSGAVDVDEVWDDCQVHRGFVGTYPFSGVVNCTKTFLVNEKVLNRRITFASNWWGAEFGSRFHPRATCAEQMVAEEMEPATLEADNIRVESVVKHPMLGICMHVPKFVVRVGGHVKYNPDLTRAEMLSINQLPLANLIYDALTAPGMELAQRRALLALVCASQVTSNLAHIFEGGRGGFGAASNVDHDINFATLLRAFISDYGRTSDEVGLALIFLQNPNGVRGMASDIRNGAQRTLLKYVAAQAAREFVSALAEVHVAMQDLLKHLVEELSASCAAHGMAEGVGADMAQLSSIPVGGENPQVSQTFLESAIRSAAERSQPQCKGFVLDVLLKLPETGTDDEDKRPEGGAGVDLGPYRESLSNDEVADADRCRREILWQMAVAAKRSVRDEMDPAARRQAQIQIPELHEYSIKPKEFGEPQQPGLHVGAQPCGTPHLRLGSRPLWIHASAEQTLNASHDDLTRVAQLNEEIEAAKKLADAARLSPHLTVRVSVLQERREQLAALEATKAELLSVRIGSIAYLRRRVIIERRDNVILSGALFIPSSNEVASSYEAYSGVHPADVTANDSNLVRVRGGHGKRRHFHGRGQGLGQHGKGGKGQHSGEGYGRQHGKGGKGQHSGKGYGRGFGEASGKGTSRRRGRGRGRGGGKGVGF